MTFVRSCVALGVILTFSACSEPETEPAEQPEPVANEPAAAEEATAEQPAAEEPAEEPAEAPADLDTAAMTAAVERVGAPLFEGATPLRLEQGEEEVKAVYLTQESYRTVKSFYDEQLPEPAWTNNGFGMGPFGGSAWQWTSAEGDLKVVVSDEDEGTEVRFLHPAE